MRASSVDSRDWVVSRLCYTQAVLRLELLGNVRVLLRGVPVSLGVKPLALLVHLALEGRASRRALATLIWQDAPRPLNNLSVAKHQLERALGDVLDADTETLALKDFSCDALEFTADNPAAWGLWRGGFFTGVRLAGWEMQLSESWQDWLYQTRSHFAALRQQIAVSLAEQRIAAGDLKGALTFLEVAASGDEPSEDAATRLMLVLGALDRPQAALEVFNCLVRLLRDELGVEAMPETKAALDLARSSAAACRTTLKPRADVVQSEASDLPFVGRDAELRCVSEWLQSGSPRVAVIEGEPGAGKTRLAVELLRGTQATTWRLECLHGSLSSATLAALARNFTGQFTDLPSDSRAALERLTGLRDARESLPPDLEQRALFTGLRSLLARASSHVGLLFDDLQWADDATLRFLGWCLSEPMPVKQFTVLVTLRSTEAARGDVPGLLADLTRRGIAQRLTLPALGLDAVQKLARQFGTSADATALHNASGGNPFYLLELLRSPDGRGRISELIRARLEGLGGVALQTLEALCVTGLTSVALLHAVSGRSPNEEYDALVALSAAALLHTGETVRFAHDLVRESVTAQLSPARAQLLHLRAARALAGTTGTASAEAATHYWAAKDAWSESDFANAVKSFLELGTRSGYQGERDASELWFERAMQFSPDNLRAVVLTEQAQLLERFGDYGTALERLSDAEWWLETDLQRARVLVARGFILQRELRDFAGAEAALKEAQGLMMGQKNRETLLVYGDALHLLGTVAFQQKKYSEALEHYQTAHRLRLNSRDDTRLAESLSGLGSACTFLNDPRAEKYMLESIQMRREVGDFVRAARSMTNLTVLYHQQGRIEDALATQRQALEMQRRIGNPTDVATSLSNVGVFLFEAGDVSGAVRYYQEAIEFMQHNNLEPQTDLLDNLAEARAALDV